MTNLQGLKGINEVGQDIIDQLKNEEESNQYLAGKFLWDMDHVTGAMMKPFAHQGKELSAHLELTDAYNNAQGQVDWQDKFMNELLQISNKYNINLNEENIMGFLSKYFVTRDLIIQAYKIWKKHSPVFEKSIYFMYKYGDCSKSLFVDQMKNDIAVKGKSTVKYVVGDSQCTNCGYNEKGYCKLYHLKIKENLVELLKEKEFK